MFMKCVLALVVVASSSIVTLVNADDTVTSVVAGGTGSTGKYMHMVIHVACVRD